MNTRKLKKFVKSPGTFFRDYLIKKYPQINCEQKFLESEEGSVYNTEKKLWEIESLINSPEHKEVDAVFTWVNDKDPKWLEKKDYYINKSNPLGCKFSVDVARFENHNELFYSVLAVKKNLPWVRNIFIVTDNQKPEWFNEDNKIIIVDHKDIIEEKYLPTFNSHVIEANLYKIKGLSENFIYFNDDVFVAKPLDQAHFFRKNGLASFFLSLKNLDRMQNQGMCTATLKASMNSRKIILEKTGFDAVIPLVHTYVPLKKSVFMQAWRECEKEILNFLPNKFRGNNDLNMATFLVPWLMYINGNSEVASEICYYFNIRSNHANRQYEKILAQYSAGLAPHSFCLNDVNAIDRIDGTDVQKKLENFLNKYFIG